MTKEWEKQIDNVCEKIVSKTKEYDFVEKPDTKYVEIMFKKSFLENCVEKFVGRVGCDDQVKGVVENCC